MSKKPRLVLVDGSAVFHRGYHAIPHLTNSKGIPTNAVYGFTTILLKMLQDLKPQYAIMTWDKSSDTFRKDIYPEYKAHRKKQPDDLYAQIPYAREVTEALGMPWVELDKYEADDIIGTLARTAEKKGLESIIVTGDLDELQLIDDNTKVYTMRRGFTDTVIYDRAAMQEKYGLTPEQFVDFKALKGDASDNIPGVAGIGEKTAMDLIKTHGSLDGVYKNIEQTSGKLRERLEEGKKVAYLSYELSQIACDAPVKLELDKAGVGRYDRQKIHELFRRLDFKSLLAKLPSELSNEPTLFDAGEPKKERKHLGDVKYQAVTKKKQLDELVATLQKCQTFAFDTETDSVDDVTAGLVGISVSCKKGEAYYIPVAHHEGDQLNSKEVCSALKAVFEDPKIGKVAHHAKFDYKILCRHGITPRPIVFDTMIAAFLTNPLGRSQSLDDLTYREFGIEMIPIKELIGHGRNQITFGGVEIEAATTYAAEDADMTWRLYEQLRRELEGNLNKLAEATEWPLIPVLAEMELAGIELDVGFLRQFSQKITKDVLALEEKIYKACDARFNISSPAQLSQILFDKLGLAAAGVKRGKTGLSTAAKELDKLREAHPVIEMIIEYRELMKLKTTYVDALPELVKPDGRVHTSFNQTIAQTGRLSSTNPNLQNIPIRTEIGREIRKAFIAPKGRVFVAADYSQIELRVAAALSKDDDMIETFKKGIDLHQQTASELYNVPLTEVTKDQRYNAKTINFGVLYGMSPHGLSVATSMNREEAAGFIKRYFELRKGLAEYIDNLKKFARENEYTETLLGRRRPCGEINSNNFMVAGAAERMAVNVPIQGTAADIMKLAMVALAPKLPEGAKMLLQIHDELIVECNEEQSAEVAKIMQETLENVYDLGVPIVAETRIGKSWGEL
ncbi:MAG TPA: DNA polymerase I [Candidatus Dormibacteraeota bacterium]|nr:DNA polymerase I [Candidatus Dormibacteraeota bacterium]